MKVSRKIKSLMIGVASAALICANVLPTVSASARTYYNGRLNDFASYYDDYEYLEQATGYEEISIDIAYTCRLSGTNNIYSGMSTVNQDQKTVTCIEWNKKGSAKSSEKTGGTAGVATSYNASFFTPTHTFHSFYTSTADYEVCVWYN